MTLTEEVFVLRSRLQIARDMIDRFTLIILEQEKEIKRLKKNKKNDPSLRNQSRPDNLPQLEELFSNRLRDDEQGQGNSLKQEERINSLGSV